jgi:hypothetical protein
MSKILEATCEAGVVTSQGVAVEATILSEGMGASEGVLVLEGVQASYITSNASDLKTTLEKVVNALTKIGETLTAIGGGMTGPSTAPPPALPANVAEINSLIAELSTLKENLK